MAIKKTTTTTQLAKLKREVKELRVLQKDFAQVKKAASFSKLFAMAQEFRLFGDKVTRPYEQVSSVYKAIKAIADNVPQADLKFRNRKTKEDIDTDPIIDLFNAPNPFMSESDLIQAWVGFHCLYGEAIIVKETSIGQAAGTGYKLPAQLWPFNPSNFQEIVQGREITGWRYDRENVVFTPEEVIFIKDFNPHSLFRGIAPTKPIEKQIDIDWQSLIFNKAFFDNDARPGLILSTEQELGDDVLKRLKSQFRGDHEGASKAFKVAVLESGLKADNVSPTHKDMDFIEQKKYTREEILGIWRAPKALFNITEDLNYATFMGQMKIFWSYAIMPVMKKVEGAINKHLVWPYNPNIEAYFDYTNVVAYQEDLKEKVTTGSALWAMGFTRNEINDRLELGFDKVPWGDVWWAPFGLTPISSAEKDEPVDPTIDPNAADPNAVPPAAEEPKKQRKSTMDPRKESIMKGFLIKQGWIEDKMAGGIGKYFMDQRKAVLKALNEQGSGFSIDWQDQDKKLKDKAEKYLYLGIKEGIELGRVLLGKKSLSDDQFEARISSFLVMRTDKITMINRTIKNHIKDTLEEGIAAGDSITMLSDRIRDIYNMASNRSIMIARTESTGAVNGGSQMYYESEGVKKREWLTANDEYVRESHQKLEGEVRLIHDDFSNGLNYPGDQKGTAAECINCRCTLIPVIE